jgi:hypothetical protein
MILDLNHEQTNNVAYGLPRLTLQKLASRARYASRRVKKSSLSGRRR